MRKITALFLVLSTITVHFQAVSQTDTKTKVNWITLEQADELRKQEPRKVLIDVYTDWCGWCKRMDATTFTNSDLVEYVNDNYYMVKLDAEQKEPITIGGKTYEFVEQGRRGYNQIAKELLQGKMSYPTIVFLDENMNMIQPLPGYRDAKELMPILEYLATEAYKTTPWEVWLKNREG
jgi:thioredoxin-related protein